MENKVLEYVEYLKKTKGISLNTEMAYRRDLMKLVKYLDAQNVSDVTQIRVTNLNSYMLYLFGETRADQYDNFKKCCIHKKDFSNILSEKEFWLRTCLLH